jgi:DNA-directed RNA polymerase alpha subunit
VHQSFKGVGKYTVENLQLPEGVEIVTENSYLFEITDPNIELNISFRLEK